VADPQILGNMTKIKVCGVDQISTYQVNIAVRMAVSVILNRLIYVPWGTAEVQIDFLSQFLIEFTLKKTPDHS